MYIFSFFPYFCYVKNVVKMFEFEFIISFHYEEVGERG